MPKREVSRRGFIGAAAAAAAASAALATAAATPAEAAAPVEAAKHSGGLSAIKHVVVVTQENRSFDHYFGSLKGVRGFGDRSTIKLPGGSSVWQQPEEPTVGAPTQYPWPLAGTKDYNGATPPSAELGAANYGGTNHSWQSQHGAWYGGLMNGWYSAKGGPTTLGYLTRTELPFHYALADAYTIGDAYHCSVLSATGPNRTYLWSGTINAGKEARSYDPSIYNADAGGTPGTPYTAFEGGDELGKFLTWESYCETLQKAGVSWTNYHCADDYGDGGARYFATFAKLDPTQTDPKTGKPGVPDLSNPLYVNGVANVSTDTGSETANAADINAKIRADVVAGKLPEVSWVINNQYFSEHPVTAPSNGANFLFGLLDALAADPDVLNSTLVIINYDENDGQFDHVPPAVPAPGEKDEFVADSMAAYGVVNPVPVGLGFRVPLLLVSPWTRGGWVTSEVADHTSVIQFLEKWTAANGKAAVSPNISAWRRRVAGDLTNAFDFANPVYGLPELPNPGPLVAETQYNPLPDNNVMPTQEQGHKRARPLPYQPNANVTGATGTSLELAFSNSAPFATKSAHFSVYNNLAPEVPGLAAYPVGFPGQYTVDPSTRTVGTVAGTAPLLGSAYDVTVVGPNRFLREFVGNTATAGGEVEVVASYWDGTFDKHSRLLLTFTNRGEETAIFTVTHNAYTKSRPETFKIGRRGRHTQNYDVLATARGWYDVTVTVNTDAGWSRRFVGHVETGEASITG